MTSEVLLLRLNSEFEKRKKANSRYSLRAYARDLNIPASILSRIRSRTIAISENLVLKLKPKLFKDEDEFNTFYCECLNSPNFISPSKKMSPKDFSYFRLWFFWMQLNLNKSNSSIVELKQAALESGLTEDDFKFLSSYFSKITESNLEPTNNFPINIFKNISHQLFEQRFIHLLYELPNAPLKEIEPYVSQSAYPLLINKNISEVIHHKVQTLMNEIVQIIEQDRSPKDQTCELIISLLPMVVDQSQITKNQCISQ